MLLTRSEFRVRGRRGGGGGGGGGGGRADALLSQRFDPLPTQRAPFGTF